MPSNLENKLERLQSTRSNMQHLYERAANDNTRNWAALELQTLDAAISTIQAELARA